MHTYKFYWLNNSAPTIANGNTVAEAFAKIICHAITDIFKYEQIN